MSFEKPAKFQHQKGQYAILNIMKPKITKLDLQQITLTEDLLPIVQMLER